MRSDLNSCDRRGKEGGKEGGREGRREGGREGMTGGRQGERKEQQFFAWRTKHLLATWVGTRLSLFFSPHEATQ